MDNCIKLLLGTLREISALGQILADQAVDVLIAASLPRAMRITEKE